MIWGPRMSARGKSSSFANFSGWAWIEVGRFKPALPHVYVKWGKSVSCLRTHLIQTLNIRVPVLRASRRNSLSHYCIKILRHTERNVAVVGLAPSVSDRGGGVNWQMTPSKRGKQMKHWENLMWDLFLPLTFSATKMRAETKRTTQQHGVF